MKYRTELTAHSGSDGTIDNSMACVRYALESGADTLEVDVRKDRNTGELQLGHDEIGQAAVYLRDVLTLLKRYPSVKINCDLKEAGLEKQVLRLADECAVREQIIFSGTVEPQQVDDADFRRERICWNIEEQFENFYDMVMAEPEFRYEAFSAMCDKMDEVGLQVINTHEALVDDRVLEIVRAHGKQLSVWTVNDMDRVEYFLHAGVKNITTRRIWQAVRLRAGHYVRTLPDETETFRVEKHFVWTQADSDSDVKIPFPVQEGTDILDVYFSYTPKWETDEEVCRGPLEHAVQEYFGSYPQNLEPMTREQYMPVKNLVTLSASVNGVYLGNAHRWDQKQHHRFACNAASRGFHAPAQMTGDWEIMLHLHEIITPECRGAVQIIGRVSGLKEADSGNNPVGAAGISGMQSQEQDQKRIPVDRRGEQSQNPVAAQGQNSQDINWYPVELHVHSWHSDADFSVAAMVQQAEACGFKGIGLSDHNTDSGLPELYEETEKRELVPIPALEWTTYYGHMLVLGEQGYTDWRGVKPEQIDPALRSIHKNGGLVGIAHPKAIANPIKTGYRWRFQVSDWSQIDFMEIWSRHDGPIRVQSLGAFDMWEKLLNRGYPITATSGRDWHRQDTNQYAHTFVGVTGELTTDKIFDALKRGRVCVSMGPLLTARVRAEKQLQEQESGQGYRNEESPYRECGESLEAGMVRIRWNICDNVMLRDRQQGIVIPERVRVVQNGAEIWSELIEWSSDQNHNNSESHASEQKGECCLKVKPGWIRVDLMGSFKGHPACILAVTNPFYIKER